MKLRAWYPLSGLAAEKRKAEAKTNPAKKAKAKKKATVPKQELPEEWPEDDAEDEWPEEEEQSGDEWWPLNVRFGTPIVLAIVPI